MCGKAGFASTARLAKGLNTSAAEQYNSLYNRLRLSCSSASLSLYHTLLQHVTRYWNGKKQVRLGQVEPASDERVSTAAFADVHDDVDEDVVSDEVSDAESSDSDQTIFDDAETAPVLGESDSDADGV